jgi:hypothetical protein
MKPTAHLIHQIQQRALVLKVTGVPDKAALRQAAAEVAQRAKAAGAAELHPRSASSLSKPHAELMEVFNRWISHIWRRPRRKSKRIIPGRNTAPEPTITENPVVIVEPQSALTADPRLQQAFPAPLVVTDIRNAKLIPNSEYPARFHDLTTSNWRQSIEDNERLQRHRAQASAAHHRNNNRRSKYVG